MLLEIVHDRRRAYLTGGDVTIDAWFTLGVVGVTVGLLILDRFNPTLVVGGAVLTLYMLGVIDQDQMLAGFSHQALAIVAALYVLAGAADATGAFEG
nr:hypothetical protein [Actinomycetes bacterium]